MHLAEVVWVYKKTTSHSVNFIPTGKSRGLVVADRSGRKTELDIGRGKSKEDKVANFVKALAGRIPWAIFGYSDEIKGLYDKKHAEFLAVVEQRYAEFSANSSAGTS
jgi:hypothetical protein